MNKCMCNLCYLYSSVKMYFGVNNTFNILNSEVDFFQVTIHRGSNSELICCGEPRNLTKCQRNSQKLSAENCGR